MTPTKSETMEASNNCHFFRLPGELRNVIYAYVLSKPGGLLFRVSSHGDTQLLLKASAIRRYRPKPAYEIAVLAAKGMLDERINGTMHENNQLQYVNREMRLETRGVGVRFNQITFLGCHDFRDFTAMCPDIHKSYLRHMTIDSSFYGLCSNRSEALSSATVPKSNSMHSLAFDFCRAFPRVTLHTTVKGWRQTKPAFVLEGLMIQMALHGRWDLGNFFEDPVNQNEMRARATSRLEGINYSFPPTNFRLHPDDDFFSETAFKTKLETNTFMTGMLSREKEGAIDRWVIKVRKFYREGI
ncbi:hypothetical protein BKA63DRAFT_496785 [Paraphoma chrysanthemicola]|nr:hypothetical protein BKA63DRAFT_496785 [Paraphoma chrysanthemicola]